MRGLDGLAGTILDRRLRAASPAPLAVAFSGGGDSLALLLVTKAWADSHGRRLIALTVDHGLNPASAGWTDRCRATASRLGVDFRALAWTGARPATGLPAAARAARHALLAEAAREAGARVLLMGHTADDLAEAAAMRAGGSTVGDPREWAPSPAWPEGRGVFLLRPLLGVRRQALRDWLVDRGEAWIEDPANVDDRFARSRARVSLISPTSLTSPSGEGDPEHQGGGVRSPHRPLHQPSDGPPPLKGRLVLQRTAPAAHIAAACLCAAGTSTPPRGDRLARLVERLRSGETFTATLAGARIEAGESVQFSRDTTRAGFALPMPLPEGSPVVWDNRFEIVADRPGMVVQSLDRLVSRLPEGERKLLKSVPASVRPTLPVIVRAVRDLTCPILAEDGPVRCQALVLPRFEAAIGLVDFEPAP